MLHPTSQQISLEATFHMFIERMVGVQVHWQREQCTCRNTSSIGGGSECVQGEILKCKLQLLHEKEHVDVKSR